MRTFQVAPNAYATVPHSLASDQDQLLARQIEYVRWIAGGEYTTITGCSLTRGLTNGLVKVQACGRSCQWNIGEYLTSDTVRSLADDWRCYSDIAELSDRPWIAGSLTYCPLMTSH